MITEKVVFETEDGKQFATCEEAEQYQLHSDIKAAMTEGDYRDGFEEREALAALLRDFNVTRKEKEA